MSGRAAVRLAVATVVALALTPVAALGASGGVSAPSESGGGGSATRPTATATFSGFTGAPTSSLTASPVAGTLIGVSDLSARPVNHLLTGQQAEDMANKITKIQHAEKRYPGSYPGVFMKGPDQWQVSYYAKQKPLKEIGQVTIVDGWPNGQPHVLEAWTGYQVPWTMARGIRGAFGHHASELEIWIPLLLLFVIPFIDPKRPFRLRHLDLLALVSFSISFAYFNHGLIGHSVPAMYPPFLYLLGRMLYIGLRRNDKPREPLKLLVPASWLIVGVVFLIGFRVALNVIDSNVIDVGDASQIGAHLVIQGKRVYHNFPENISQGDTYGPTVFLGYVPFVKAFGLNENQRQATHAAAITFDLLTVMLLWFLGRRIRGPTLGAALAYAWVTYPFTLFISATNSNDALVALTLVLVLLVASKPVLRGGAAALAAFTKFAPLPLVPVMATHERKLKPFVFFCLAFGVTTVVIWIPFVIHGPSLVDIWNRTIGYQAGRGAPFSAWGYTPGGLGSGAQHVWEALTVIVALVLAVVPRRRDVVGLAALCAAILIMVELGATYWFYLYIPWFFPLVMVAVLGQSPELSAPGGDEPEPIEESAAPEPQDSALARV